MFTKVIVGDNGLAGGRDAIALAQALAPGAELVLARTYPWDPAPSRFGQHRHGDALRDEAEQALHESRERAGVPDARIVTAPDTSPARGLHRVASEEHADLLIVGSAHHGAFGRAVLGDVARAVLHGAPCPVAVAPRGTSASTPATIGVAFDDSPEARAALDLAAGLAESLGAGLVIREIVEPDFFPATAGYPVPSMDVVFEDMRRERQQALDGLAGRFAVTVEAQAVTGMRFSGLADLTRDVDLVVCGSRGWGAIRRVVLGSTADRLIHHAACPVLVVPRTATPVEALETTPVAARV